VLKLLRKNPEDRYQSAFGLQADLQTCRDALASGKAIIPFDLGKLDFSGRLEIPNKLYGRQKEIGYLLDAFERSCQGTPELIFIAGYSGVGKSALVHEINKPITERKGFFIEGKFEQLQKNVPYLPSSRLLKVLSTTYSPKMWWIWNVGKSAFRKPWATTARYSQM
ncbi:MAG: AAA family ATPase, partial [Bacteroidia bacterium]|nr:AAA family ATPase [Bacteroidia bacterium]